jgi:hypothetical protein
MTDCLSDDDDEEHHPVYFLKCIVCPCTQSAEEKLSGSNPEYAHLLSGSDPVLPAFPDNAREISPFFLNRGSYGLIGS